MQLSRERIKQELLAILSKRAPDTAKLSENTNIVLDLNLDSLQLMELVADIEDRFAMEIPLELIDQVKIVSDAVNLIEKLAKSNKSTASC